MLVQVREININGEKIQEILKWESKGSGPVRSELLKGKAVSGWLLIWLEQMDGRWCYILWWGERWEVEF